MRTIIENQRLFFQEGKTKDFNYRRTQLEKLKQAIIQSENQILNALEADLNKSEFEAYLTEIGIVLQEINYTLKNLTKWAKPIKVKTPITQALGKSRIYSEPYGVVLIISPWNYPFQLIMAPLIGAIAAGNCVVLKTSPQSARTGMIIEKIIKEVFEKRYIAVIQGDEQVHRKILEEKFDYIFFTGSAAVGKIVMEAAAKNLTPLTLELGGKSPCIVEKSANIELAAKRIVWGKLLNSGQTCVAPDYLLVERSIKIPLIAALKKYIEEFYGDNPLDNPDYPKIINQTHFNRLKALLSGNIVYGGNYKQETNQISPTLLDNISWDSEIMQEEIFGPLLPILEFEDFNNLILEIQKNPKPLSLYLFTEDREKQKQIIKNLSFGGGCINDTVIHLATPYLPFGGVGKSGIGAYHGKWSFDTFSHKKGILKQSNLIDLPFRYPNFKRGFSLVKRIMQGFP